MMKHTGIWIDKREAKITFIDNGNETLVNIESEVEEFNPKGGSRSRSKDGPQDVVQDSKYLNREKKQLSDFFEKVAERIKGADDIVIFGPAETGEKLYKELADEYPKLHANVRAVERADDMTDNQLKAWVRDYFKQDGK